MMIIRKQKLPGKPFPITITSSVSSPDRKRRITYLEIFITLCNDGLASDFVLGGKFRDFFAQPFRGDAQRRRGNVDAAT